MMTQPRTTMLTPMQVDSVPAASAMDVRGLSAWYGRFQAIRSISLHFPPQSISAIIGPSGCGKSTLIRCLNRMHELVPGARTKGIVLLDEANIYAKGVDPVT